MNKPQSIDDFTFNTVIGKGTYAKVCLVTRKTDGEVFALKVLKKKYIVEKNQVEHIMT
jgi:RAC serine/threonine-protein kinase